MSQPKKPKNPTGGRAGATFSADDDAQTILDAMLTATQTAILWSDPNAPEPSRQESLSVQWAIVAAINQLAHQIAQARLDFAALYHPEDPKP